jgi:iron complex outermembrane receptor protein
MTRTLPARAAQFSSRLPPATAVALAAALAGLLSAAPARADGPAALQPDDYADMSIEELANIEVTSVSRRPERLQDAPASVYVITADDIRRAGARSLAEALRLAPNLDVARTNNTNYNISARGMNGSSGSPANKLLVLIDGRSVYSPLFSGVFWDEPDVMLEDVERIEVISGPGGTLWGVNAVNGVINITTRNAADTHGNLAALRADEEGAQAAFRHGGGTMNASWRIYGKTFGLKQSHVVTGRENDDNWDQSQVGLRADWLRGADRYGLTANAWRGTQAQPQPGELQAPGATKGIDDIDTRGTNLTGHWDHALADGGSLALQASYDQRYRRVPPTFTDSVDIADLQFQHALPALGSHSIVWGAEYRYSWDHVTGSRYVAFVPASDKQAWAALFGQDEYALRDDLRLTAGARFERNPYTGVEFLPNLRLSWRVSPTHQLWAAVSRTVRAPSRLDVDVYIPAQAPYLLAGGPQVVSETARVFEAGYRGQVGSELSYSVSAYRNLYDHLRTQETVGRQIALASGMGGHAQGVEAWGNAQLSDKWRVSAGLTALHEEFGLKAGSHSSGSTRTSGFDPAYTAQLRSSYAIDSARELDVSVRHVAGRTLVPGIAIAQVPAYTALDLRYGWRMAPGIELSVIGANLNGGHSEFGIRTLRSEVPRSIGLQLIWQD